MMPQPPGSRSAREHGYGLMISNRRNSTKPTPRLPHPTGTKRQRDQHAGHLVNHHHARVLRSPSCRSVTAGAPDPPPSHDDGSRLEHRRPGQPNRGEQQQRCRRSRRARRDRAITDEPERGEQPRRDGSWARCQASGTVMTTGARKAIVKRATLRVERRGQQAQPHRQHRHQPGPRCGPARGRTDTRPPEPVTTLSPSAILPIVWPAAAVNASR